jgi:hypothetical protein
MQHHQNRPSIAYGITDASLQCINAIVGSTINSARLSVPSVIRRHNSGYCIALDAGSNCGLEVAGRWWLMEAPESRYKRRKIYRLGIRRQAVIMAEILDSGERIMNPLNPLKIPLL